MKNAFTVDVEEYFHVTAFANTIDRQSWERRESRVQRSTEALLELLSEKGVHATFFVLGWVAKRYPDLVREIARQGHEVASHGLNHQLIYQQSPLRFRDETRHSKRLLEDIVQRPVIGYRAATYSIIDRSLWALDILAEEGFLYDSSIFPMRHDRYGIPGAQTAPHRRQTRQGRTIVEFPISVVRLRGLTLPVAGGGYFRLLPYAVTRWGLSRINQSGEPFVFYIHPWEIDPEQPRVEGAGALSRFRHYSNLDKCQPRLSMLLDDFNFTTVEAVLSEKGLLSANAGTARNAAAPAREASTQVDARAG